MFKKTVIAAALATFAAAPAAMADVSVSGQVKLTILDVEDGAEYGPRFENQVWFKASEDLGNGMSAFAQIGLDTDSSIANNDTTKDQKLGLKGSFGTVVGGRMETLTEGAVSSMMDDGAHAHGASTQLESTLTAAGRLNAIAYVSPTVNGFHVAAAGTLSDADDMIESTDIAAVYANGPMTVKASVLSFDDAGDVTTLGASYAMGDAKVSVMRASADDDAVTNTTGADADDTMVRLDYKMGNNGILLANKDADTGSDMNVIKFTHKMSKRTAVWIGHRNKDDAADVTHFGMIHKF